MSSEQQQYDFTEEQEALIKEKVEKELIIQYKKILRELLSDLRLLQEQCLELDPNAELPQVVTTNIQQAQHQTHKKSVCLKAFIQDISKHVTTIRDLIKSKQEEIAQQFKFVPQPTP